MFPRHFPFCPPAEAYRNGLRFRYSLALILYLMQPADSRCLTNVFLAPLLDGSVADFGPGLAFLVFKLSQGIELCDKRDKRDKRDSYVCHA